MRNDMGTKRTGMLVMASCTALVAMVACGGGGEKAADTGTAAPVPPVPAAGGVTATGGPIPSAPPAGATAGMVALGDSIFHGLAAGGLCFTCHGIDANGTPLAPSLTDSQWLTSDSSFTFIQTRVTEGKATPTPPFTTPMLPKGGSTLTPDQIKAVSAYVYAISHKSG